MRRTRAAGPGPGDVLEVLLDGLPRTRAEVGALTGLSRSTVAARVDALVAAGLVVPAASAGSSGGRPATRVAFNPRARVVLGVDLGATHATVAVCDLAEEILAARTVPMEIARGPAAVLGAVAEMAETLLAGLSLTVRDVAAVGVGLPGPVDHALGRPQHPPIMPGWHDADVPALIAERIPGVVLVDNDVNVLALGEHAASWPDVDDLVYVKVSTGVGAGIIAGGLLQHGARGSAGDLGHVVVPWSPGDVRPAGERRELEDVASGAALATALRAAGTPAHSARDVVALVLAGDRTAIDAVRQAGRELGAVLATVVTLLGPSVIVIGGTIARAGEHLIAGVREVVYGSSTPLASRNLQIVPARADENAGARGAAILASRAVLAPDSIHRLIHPSVPPGESA
ncbi:ROK family transcriptional regulator [Microbacterium lushaniae]|uniref:ROK family transcriptional regulator n=1 Tax=Microbacterium lushaniae TaxID=2614639 RepID=A0A5J6L5M8_9MICO|nr:ROK family transcriptional regulator [Microbacterium lushaniae]QEW03740.1 ROK family transcriptional regulator [Microbacterium lushaniae]